MDIETQGLGAGSYPEPKEEKTKTVNLNINVEYSVSVDVPINWDLNEIKRDFLSNMSEYIDESIIEDWNIEEN